VGAADLRAAAPEGRGASRSIRKGAEDSAPFTFARHLLPRIDIVALAQTWLATAVRW
jgi:hypothetical protein